MIHCCSTHPHRRSNAAVLLLAYLIFVLEFSAEEAYGPFIGIEPPFIPFRDAAFAINTFPLTVLDCARAFYRVQSLGHFRFKDFSLPTFRRLVALENGDISWIIPGKFIAFSGPINKRRQIRPGVNTLLPEEYVPVFKSLGVTCIVRFNSKCYDRNIYLAAKIRHVDLFYEDGANPPESILQSFLQLCEGESGVIAVHCKAGLGRTGTNIAAYMIKHYGYTAKESTAWCRVCRPGSVVGPQQQYLMSVEPRLRAEGELFRVRFPNSTAGHTPFKQTQAQQQQRSSQQQMTTVSTSSNTNRVANGNGNGGNRGAVTAATRTASTGQPIHQYHTGGMGAAEKNYGTAASSGERPGTCSTVNSNSTANSNSSLSGVKGSGGGYNEASYRDSVPSSGATTPTPLQSTISNRNGSPSPLSPLPGQYATAAASGGSPYPHAAPSPVGREGNSSPHAGHGGPIGGLTGDASMMSLQQQQRRLSTSSGFLNLGGGGGGVQSQSTTPTPSSQHSPSSFNPTPAAKSPYLAAPVSVSNGQSPPNQFSDYNRGELVGSAAGLGVSGSSAFVSPGSLTLHGNSNNSGSRNNNTTKTREKDKVNSSSEQVVLTSLSDRSSNTTNNGANSTGTGGGGPHRQPNGSSSGNTALQSLSRGQGLGSRPSSSSSSSAPVTSSSSSTPTKSNKVVATTTVTLKQSLIMKIVFHKLCFVFPG